MKMQTILNNQNMTKYRLSKLSGVPLTTITDICAGRSDLERCTAKTVFQIAKALQCSVEDLMTMDAVPEYDQETGLPTDKSYLECGLPPYLQESLEKMKTAWKMKDSGKNYLHWDCDYCELQTDINCAEVDGEISTEQAWYLREKYLRVERVKN